MIALGASGHARNRTNDYQLGCLLQKPIEVIGIKLGVKIVFLTWFVCPVLPTSQCQLRRALAEWLVLSFLCYFRFSLVFYHYIYFVTFVVSRLRCNFKSQRIIGTRFLKETSHFSQSDKTRKFTESF